MANALTIQSVQQELATLAPEIAKALPPGITADRFSRVALTAVQNNPDLLRCDHQSLFNACMKAAQDGLLPDGREGAIIPRKGQATWQPMVQGLVAKAKRRGSVVNLVANIVYEGEPFEVLMGDEDRILHRRELDKVKKGAEVAVYAIAALKDGTKEREVMTWDEVQAVRRMSSTPNAGPWVTSEGEMARKTCIRRLAKRLPALDDGDDDLRQAIERVDDLYPFGKNAPQRQAPVIEHEKPAKSGGMVEVARATTRAPVEPPSWLDEWVGKLHDAANDAEWLSTFEDACKSAPDSESLVAFMGVPSVSRPFNSAPADPKAKMQAASGGAFKRLEKPAAAESDGWPGPTAGTDGEIAPADRLRA